MRGAATADIAIKGFVNRGHRPNFDQCPANMRPPNRAITRDCLDTLLSYRDAKRVQFRDDCLPTRVTSIA